MEFHIVNKQSFCLTPSPIISNSKTPVPRQKHLHQGLLYEWMIRKAIISYPLRQTASLLLEEKVGRRPGLFGRMPSALAPKGTRLSLKMPAAFPKVNRRMRCRESSYKINIVKQTAAQNVSLKDMLCAAVANCMKCRCTHHATSSVSCAASVSSRRSHGAC